MKTQTGLIILGGAFLLLLLKKTPLAIANNTKIPVGMEKIPAKLPPTTAAPGLH